MVEKVTHEVKLTASLVPLFFMIFLLEIIGVSFKYQILFILLMYLSMILDNTVLFTWRRNVP